MTETYKHFKGLFEEQFPDGIYDFINQADYQDFVIPWEGKLVENLDDTRYDSYGNEDSTLRRIYHFQEFDIYVEFYGTRTSYNGEDWNVMQEVKRTEKTIQIWE